MNYLRYLHQLWIFQLNRQLPTLTYLWAVSLLLVLLLVSKDLRQGFEWHWWAKISRTLGQIRDLPCFRDLCTIVWDNSDTNSIDTRKKNFFFDKRTNQQIALEYCVLSVMEAEEFRSELDESDLMMMDEFKRILDFYKTEKTTILAERDMDLEATILAERALEVPSRTVVENILVEEDIPAIHVTDADEVMEDIESLSEYTLSRAEKFYMDCS